MRSLEFEYVIIYFSVPKGGGAIIRGGAIFGGNTVYINATTVLTIRYHQENKLTKIEFIYQFCKKKKKKKN